MRYFLLLFIFCFNNLFAGSLKVITYNLRYDNAGDGINQWEKRKNKVDSLLHHYSPDVLCIQEGLNNQVNDLQTMLPDYFYVGVGRDDGKEKGEYSAIFFRKNLFKLESSGNFWLSPTPDLAGSRGWDAACVRICTYAKIKSQKNGKIFFVFNTHFDHQGEVARKESAKLILEKIKKIADKSPVIFTGDLNSEPNSSTYQIITSNSVHPLFDNYLKHSNKECTFTGFEVKSEICKRIDFIFSDKNFSCSAYKIIDDNDGTYYPSDHEAVEAILEFKK